jgi:hypothetical protein
LNESLMRTIHYSRGFCCITKQRLLIQNVSFIYIERWWENYLFVMSFSFICRDIYGSRMRCMTYVNKPWVRTIYLLCDLLWCIGEWSFVTKWVICLNSIMLWTIYWSCDFLLYDKPLVFTYRESPIWIEFYLESSTSLAIFI